MSVVISVVNQKGGVGKTTTTVNLAATLAGMGKQVLLVDLDPQAHTTEHIGIQEKSASEKTVLEAMLQKEDISHIIRSTYKTNLFILPANLRLGLFNQMSSQTHKMNLRQAFEGEVRNRYEYVIIDCQPSLSLLTFNALIASDEILLPVQSEFLALDGLSQLILTFKEVKTNYQPDLSVLGIVLTMYDKRNRLSSEIRKELERNFGDNLFETVIPRSVRFAEAPSFGKAITEYAPGSNAARAYEKLAREIVAKIESRRKALQQQEEHQRHTEFTNMYENS